MLIRTFFTTFLSVVDFVAPIKSFRVKSNNKPWFNVLNPICNHEQNYKKSKQSGKEIDKGNFRCPKL